MNEEPKYEEALAQLEAIVRKMEANELDIDQIAEQLKTAQRLIKLCRDKLTKTEEEIQQLRQDNKTA
jgi:exodeoxyribonuclease VII small subunit